jgi:hypothetical protein
LGRLLPCCPSAPSTSCRRVQSAPSPSDASDLLPSLPLPLSQSLPWPGLRAASRLGSLPAGLALRDLRRHRWARACTMRVGRHHLGLSRASGAAVCLCGRTCTCGAVASCCSGRAPRRPWRSACCAWPPPPPPHPHRCPARSRPCQSSLASRAPHLTGTQAAGWWGPAAPPCCVCGSACTCRCAAAALRCPSAPGSSPQPALGVASQGKLEWNRVRTPQQQHATRPAASRSHLAA